MADNRVLIRYTSGPRKGQEFILSSPEAAARVHPAATIVKYVNGKPYEGAQTAPPELVDNVSATERLAAHTAKELRAMAETLNVEVPPKARKDEIVQIVATAQEATT